MTKQEAQTVVEAHLHCVLGLLLSRQDRLDLAETLADTCSRIAAEEAERMTKRGLPIAKDAK